jgi:tRNA A37 threonylcarbamoyladenosine biosynthesis protein TsaE
LGQIKTLTIIGLMAASGLANYFDSRVGKILQIPDQIVSPTYNYILEYDFNRHGATGKLQHLDAWKINNSGNISDSIYLVWSDLERS